MKSPVRLLLASALLSAAPFSRAATNLVANGHFDNAGSPLAHWNTRYDQPGESFYFQNHEYVGVVADGTRKHVLKIHVPNVSIAENQGVKADSFAIPVDPAKSYKLTVEARSTGPKARIMLEGWRRSPKAKDKTAPIPVRTDLRRAERFPMVYFTAGDAGGMAEIPRVWTKKSLLIPGLASAKGKKFSDLQRQSRERVQFVTVHIVAIGAVGDLFLDDIRLEEVR
ncbi:MAG: hypothetical protein ACOX5G_05665 [Kiritimatiellia bacterium]|jgi:hypothetical protein